LASITSSLIIVRSEEAINYPQTLPTSVATYPVVESGDQLGIGKESRNQDGKVIALGSMPEGVDSSRGSDEDV
jgi:hypothetical protein